MLATPTKTQSNVLVDVANQAVNTTLPAATTVDVAGVECLALTQTTAGVTITLPAPTKATLHKSLLVENGGNVAFTVAGGDSFALNAGESRHWRWNGTNWKLLVPGLTTAQTAAVQSLVAGGVADSASLTLTAAHANTNRIPSAALAYTINASTGWNVSDNMAIWLPTSGTISIAVTGGPTVNGATATVVRLLSGNPAGYVILSRIQGALAYSVSGA